MEDQEEIVSIYQRHCSRIDCIPTGVTPELRAFPEIKAVIFDLYGTLFISGSGDISTTITNHRETIIRSVLSDFQVSAPGNALSARLTELISQAHDQSVERGIGYPEVEIREIWRELTSPYADLSPAQIEAIAATYEAQVNPVWPMPNLAPTLQQLSQSSLQLGVISNAQFYTHALFPALLPDLSITFNPLLCAFSYQERQAKPGLHLFQKISAQLKPLDILPSEVLYLGNDTRNDIDPAHRIGFRTVLFAGDARSYRPRSGQGYALADATITDLSQLLDLIPHLA